MIRTCDIEQHRPANPMLFCHSNRYLNFSALARNHDLAGCIDVCNIDIGICGQPAHGVFICPDHRRHCARSGSAGFVHQFATPLHKF